MARPPSALLEATVNCGARVDNVLAMRACEAAAKECGFQVAARTRKSLVLMPGPKRALFACLAPNMGGSSGPKAAGRGITAELVADDEGDGLAFAVATPQIGGGEAFVSALSQRLEDLCAAQTPSVSSTAAPATQQEQQNDSTRFKQEAQAYYYCSRMLCDTREVPGQAASEFVQDFVGRFAGLSPTALELGKGGPMMECSSAVDRLSRLVQEQLGANDTSPSMQTMDVATEIGPWVKGAVEKCVFTRVGGPLLKLYESRHSAEDAQYEEKAEKLSSVESTALLDALGVPSEFRGWLQACSEPSCSSTSAGPTVTVSTAADEGAIGGSSDTCDPGSPISPDSPQADKVVEQVGGSTPSGAPADSTEHAIAGTLSAKRKELCGFIPDSLCDAGPYERAAAALSQLEAPFAGNGRGRAASGGVVPRDAVEALVLSQLEMKTCALESSSGKAELNSMDDIMPVFIFVLVRSTLSRPFACSRFMSDSLSQDQRLESEGRAVLLLESAARHVAYDWDIDDLVRRKGMRMSV